MYILCIRNTATVGIFQNKRFVWDARKTAKKQNRTCFFYCANSTTLRHYSGEKQPADNPRNSRKTCSYSRETSIWLETVSHNSRGGGVAYTTAIHNIILYNSVL